MEHVHYVQPLDTEHIAPLAQRLALPRVEVIHSHANMIAGQNGHAIENEAESFILASKGGGNTSQ